MDEALVVLGLTTAQYAALAMLEQSTGESSAELARRMFVTAQSMNEIILRLEDRHLVVRDPHPVHGRILQTHLTSAGQKTLNRAHRLVGDVEKQMESGLNKPERRALVDMLRRCTAALGNTTT